MKIILFNGPPSSGKDTFGEMLYAQMLDQWYNSHDEDLEPCMQSFKTHLIDLVLNYYNIPDCDWVERYNEAKEEPWDLLDGMSQREALQDMSEKKMKPLLGRDYFGKAIARRLPVFDDDKLHTNTQVHIFTDGGFVEELQPIMDKAGIENVLIIRLHREGCDFSIDTRAYLDIEGV